MILEAVTVCINYGDFLAAVAPYNRAVFDRWIIVTTPDDKETRDVCYKYGLDTVISEQGDRDGPLSKGRLINAGLHQVRAGAWRIHLDADVALPIDARIRLERAHLDEANIYGIDRVMVKGWSQWHKMKASGYLESQHCHPALIAFPAGYQVGSRFIELEQGYVPIGFFQLWHGKADEWCGLRIKPYPVNHGNACRTDTQMGLQWDRRNRVLLPELIGVHLESEALRGMGANWNGRTTTRFEAPRPVAPIQEFAERETINEASTSRRQSPYSEGPPSKSKGPNPPARPGPGSPAHGYDPQRGTGTVEPRRDPIPPNLPEPGPKGGDAGPGRGGPVGRGPDGPNRNVPPVPAPRGPSRKG